MYRLAENHDADVCLPVLDSLNEEIPTRATHADEYVNEVHPLMRNRFIVDVWSDEKFHWTIPSDPDVEFSQWELALIDFENDGVDDLLIRINSNVGDWWFHSVFYEPSNYFDISLSNITEESVARIILRYMKLTFHGFDMIEHADKQYFEVLLLNDRYYVMISREYFTTLPNLNRVARIQVLEFNSSYLSKVCGYWAKIPIDLR